MGKCDFLHPQIRVRKEKKRELDLQAIPKQDISEPKIAINEINDNLSEIPLESIPEDVTNAEEVKKSDTSRVSFLQEITPKPYTSSVIASKNVYGSPSKIEAKKKASESKSTSIPAEEVPISGKKKSQSRTQEVKPKIGPKRGTAPSSSTSSAPKTQVDDTLVKQQKLQDDMSSVLSVLSKNLAIPIEEKSKSASTEGNKLVEEKLPPTSMNEILKTLLNIDPHIEASAIIKGDGTILASALSDRVSDSLFATIGQNLSMIGNDIVEGLQAGKLKTVSVRGSEGVLDLAPIDKDSQFVKDMVLVIFSHPKVKSGVVNIAANLVRKQVKDYLGVKEE